ncbi:MAG TPA: 4-hydroxy-tetrahydrodipicolinate synthase [Polyangiaceae bacterium]|nr:4-hydroxy-tetrahydrodipicolinate synthase [Polyangiaceae bacterium]
MAELVVSGAYTALVTPFTADGSAVDWAAYDKLLEHQLDGRISGLVPCGTTGEAPTLSESEHHEVVARTVRIARGRAQVVVGTGSNNTKKTIELSRAAFEAGADAVMVVMPYYNKPSQDGLFNHVKLVAQGVSGSVILYNIPGRSSVDLRVDTLLRILDACPNVIGLKDASGNVLYCQELVSRTGSRCSVLSGDDALTLPMMSVGATGVISVTSNLFPRAVSELVDDALAGRLELARRKQLALYPVHRAMFYEPNPAPIKAALAQKGMMSDAVRPPLVAASAACKQELTAALSAFEAT